MASSADLAAFWFVHTATVQPYLGGGRYGDRWDTAREIPCFAITERIVTTQADGTEVTGDGTHVYVALEHAAELVEGSKVTVLGQPEARVRSRRINDPGSLDLPGHVKVTIA